MAPIPNINTIPGAIALVGSFITFVVGILGAIKIVYGSNNSKEKNVTKVAELAKHVIIEWINAKNFQTNQDVNKTITDRENQLMERVFDPFKKNMERADIKLMNKLEAIENKQNSQNEQIVEIKTLLKIGFKAQNVQLPDIVNAKV